MSDLRRDSLGEAEAENLLSRYGLAGALTRLPGENLNYLLCTAGGGRYVLKVAAAGYSDWALDIEHRAAECVARADLGLSVPRTVLTTDGCTVATTAAHGRAPLRARLLEFVRGEPWNGRSDPSPRLLADLGVKLARLDLVLAGFSHPASRRTHRWDLAALDQHLGKVQLVKDPYRQRLLEWAFRCWTAWAKPRLAGLPHSFIHGDVNDENVLIEGDEVVGLLDFGDGLENPLVCELAIALAYVMLDAREPLSAGAAVVGAYHRVRPLGREELEALFALICGRLANTVAVAAERRLVAPEHATWYATENRAWALLERLHRSEPAAASARLAGATGVDLGLDAGATPANRRPS